VIGRDDPQNFCAPQDICKSFPPDSFFASSPLQAWRRWTNCSPPHPVESPEDSTGLATLMIAFGGRWTMFKNIFTAVVKCKQTEFNEPRCNEFKSTLLLETPPPRRNNVTSTDTSAWQNCKHHQGSNMPSQKNAGVYRDRLWSQKCICIFFRMIESKI